MRHSGMRRGAWLCVALAIFGGAVLAVFFRAARHSTGGAGAGGGFGVPQRILKLASLNVQRESIIAADVVKMVRGADADLVFLQEVRGKDLDALRQLLGGSLASAAYYPLQNLPDGGAEIGNAILAKGILEDARPIPNHMSGAAGVWASIVVDGRRFYVACLRLSDGGERKDELGNFVKAWESLGGPPIIAAVDAGEAGLPQAMPLKAASGDDSWLASEDWRMRSAQRGNVVHFLTVDARQRR